jgi:hypothetical protein
MQQDAEELYSSVMTTLSNNLKEVRLQLIVALCEYTSVYRTAGFHGSQANDICLLIIDNIASGVLSSCDTLLVEVWHSRHAHLCKLLVYMC